jgi:O-antigen ligase
MAGGVHRRTLAVIMMTLGVAVTFWLVGMAVEGRPIRLSRLAMLPALFVLIPAVQSLPLPVSVRNVVDPRGTSILLDVAVVRPSIWPLSLDPPSTRVHIGRAAAALAVFLMAYHLASGRRNRLLLTRAIGLAGVAAVVIGAGHKMFGVARIYGMFTSTPRTLLVGPFVNANHTAELLELAAFACLACSYHRRTALNRVGWLIGVVLCAGGMAATLSRGAIVGGIMGLLLFLVARRFAQETTPAAGRAQSVAWGVGILGLVIVAAGALGATQILERFRAANVGSDLRLQLWRDSLRVFAAHPLGIGRGAFERVFPIYRTVKSDLPVRFAFVENQPLQMLIDTGVIFSAMLVVASGWVVWHLVRHGRRDRVEAALAAGLFAVIVHNLFDFGLETLGVLLPFMAILGTALGRTAKDDKAPKRVPRWPLVAICCGGLIVGLASVAHASYDNFDELLKQRRGDAERRELLLRAQRVHPLDYY